MEKNKLQHHNITTDTLFDDIQNIIEQGRQQAYAAANQITVLTYWHIGRRIVEEEQHGETRAQYGTRLIKTLAEQLMPKYGNTFSKRNLDYFRQFYLCFSDLEIVNTRVHNLTWSHFRSIIQVADPKAREWYVKEASEQMWSVRTLNRNIGTQYYGRRMACVREEMQKQVQTSMGEVTVSTPRDRNATFEPQFIKKKRETILAEGVADRIIGLYALGNSTREISDWMKENLGNRVSAETISSITDRVLPEIKAWRSRNLDPVYPIVWLDAIHYKVMDDRGCAISRAIYNVLAIDKEGRKDLLGMYISKNEGANFWLNVLTDLQNRGVRDILIACVDGLKGVPDAIQSVFPDTIVQLCVVHQIRNSVKYVGSKHQKEFIKDLKHVYGAVSKETAEIELLNLDEKWGEKYPIVIRSWQDNWERHSE